MVESKSLRVLTYIVMGYMLLAFSWWAILLFTKNKDAYVAKTELLKIQAAAEGIRDRDAFTELSYYQELTQRYERQEKMILVEGLMFVISLLIALLFIHRSYRKAVASANQRRNFLLSITHELKSPLASLKLANETIVRKELPRDKLKLLARNNVKDTDRLSKLVDNLLLAAKVEDNHTIKKEGIVIAQLIKELVDYYKKLYPHHHFEYEISDERVVVHADKPSVNSILRNLIENGIKYSGPDVHIKICLQSESDRHILIVADRGIGIAKGERDKVFEQFYRVGSEDTRKTKGTGLGLFIVHKLIDLHEWKINIRSHQPKGTQFVITIPRIII